MAIKARWLVVLLAVSGCTPGIASMPPALQAAAADYPPIILGANVHAAVGNDIPRACAAAGARVDQKGGPSFMFGGTDPSDPDLCIMTIDGQTMKAWYDIWVTDWPGAADARGALREVIHGSTGAIAGFDTHSTPTLQWHDFVRNEGIEDINLLGRIYHALKISHYREGFDGNDYRSVSTIWKDIPTGMIIYGTYQHIAGKPELDDPIIPTAIVPAP